MPAFTDSFGGWRLRNHLYGVILISKHETFSRSLTEILRTGLSITSWETTRHLALRRSALPFVDQSYVYIRRDECLLKFPPSDYITPQRLNIVSTFWSLRWPSDYWFTIFRSLSHCFHLMSRLLSQYVSVLSHSSLSKVVPSTKVYWMKWDWSDSMKVFGRCLTSI